ncbi:hypothetical protein [Paenibacillus glucanolyticus]|uniref:hypothetical protein n=1 Tax=Paenibacillus glucanolyticus TaxID=59843 RepID=UPI00128D0B6F|nr:hypothetical protein [Paenibacillus glucanolyticus]MPY20548.1 hypothetical protein [Paenibacillus glucanolyticus]
MGTKISEEALFHFRLIPAEQIRGGIVCFLFIMLIPALVTLSEPMMSIYFYIACAVWGAMLLWGIGLSLNPYQSEVGFVLYLGLYGLALAVTCQVAILKMMYHMAGVDSIGYGLSSVAVMLLLLVLFYFLHFRALQQGAYQSMERQGRVGKAGKVAMLFAAIGYTGYYLAVAVIGDIGRFVMGMAAFSILLILGLYLAVVFIHRYFFIQSHMDQLKEHYPVVGLPKEQRNAAYLNKMKQGRAPAVPHRPSKKRRG